MRTCPLIAVLCGLLLSPSSPEAKIIRVALDGSGADGMSWETAYITVSAGIVNAVSGDAIWVKEGLYAEAIDLKSGVGIYGGFVGIETEDQFDLRDWNAHPTILYAGGTGRQVVRATDVNSSTLDGFTLTRGSGNSGGGIRSSQSQLAVMNCKITDNTAGSFGGGISSHASSMLIRSCIVWENSISSVGAAGISVSGDDPDAICRLEYCKVFANEAHLEGGGIYCSSRGPTTLDTCLIYGNRVFDGPDTSAKGGGLYVRDTTVNLQNCTVVDNYQGNGYSTADKVSVFFERVEIPAIPKAIIQSSIIADRIASALNANPVVEASYSFFPALVPGQGNITGNPLLAGAGAANPYTLLAGSPCIDAATRTTSDRDLIGTPRPLDVPGVGIDGPNAFDMGAYEYPGPFSNSHSDINKDGKVDAEDLLLLQEDWQKVGGP
jgi:hypothetical protein